MEKRTLLIGVCVLTLMSVGSARGQSTTATAYGATAPVLALPGATISVCAFNWVTGPVPSGPITVVEQIVDVAIGAAVAQQVITLPISPFDQHRPTPCVQLTVPPAATSPAGPGELVVGAIILYPPPATGTASPTVPATLFSASLNVSGNSVQTIPIPVQTVASSLGSPMRSCRAVPDFVTP